MIHSFIHLRKSLSSGSTYVFGDLLVIRYKRPCAEEGQLLLLTSVLWWREAQGLPCHHSTTPQPHPSPAHDCITPQWAHQQVQGPSPVPRLLTTFPAWHTRPFVTWPLLTSPVLSSPFPPFAPYLPETLNYSYVSPQQDPTPTLRNFSVPRMHSFFRA